MKCRLFAAVIVVASLFAGPARAATSLITPDGIRYTLVPESSSDVQIVRAEEDTRISLIVPTTQDAVKESQVQLAYDSATDTLFVVWAREASGVGEVRYATLGPGGHWSPARLVTAGATMYRGLQFIITHAETSDTTATLMHVAWWSVNGRLVEPEYAMFAFENARFVSAELRNLEDFVAAGGTVDSFGFEEAGSPVHPPLALDRNGDAVDVLFGKVDSTKVTLMSIVPRKVGGNVRIWKPLGRKIKRTPSSGLVSLSDEPVEAYINNGHVALYSIGEELRFTVLRQNGTWSPVRALRVYDDAAVDLRRELENTVEELLDEENQSSDDEAAMR